jgi:hypothetical protein
MNQVPDFDPPTYEESMTAFLGIFMLMAGSLNGMTDVITGTSSFSYGIMLGLVMWLAPTFTYAKRELKKHNIDIFQR